MAAQKPLIKTGSIARITDKLTGKFLGFIVRSNTNFEVFYQVTCTRIAGECIYSCTCEAKTWGHADCCHCKAVKELVAARKELEAERKAREIAAREAIQPAYYQAIAKAESRHLQGKQAFEAVCEQVWAIAHHERYVAPITVEQDKQAREAFRIREEQKRAEWEEDQARREESIIVRMEKQREMAMKTGGFSILKVA